MNLVEPWEQPVQQIVEVVSARNKLDQYRQGKAIKQFNLKIYSIISV